MVDAAAILIAVLLIACVIPCAKALRGCDNHAQVVPVLPAPPSAPPSAPPAQPLSADLIRQAALEVDRSAHKIGGGSKGHGA